MCDRRQTAGRPNIHVALSPSSNTHAHTRTRAHAQHTAERLWMPTHPAGHLLMGCHGAAYTLIEPLRKSLLPMRALTHMGVP